MQQVCHATSVCIYHITRSQIPYSPTREPQTSRSASPMTLTGSPTCSPRTATARGHIWKLRILTPWSRVFLEKLTGFQLVKKFPTFYGTRRFITTFTSARQLSLSRASSIHSMPPHPTSWTFPTKSLYTPLLSPYVLHVPPIPLFSILSPERYWVRSTDH
jgi:hypothetical protein